MHDTLTSASLFLTELAEQGRSLDSVSSDEVTNFCTRFGRGKGAPVLPEGGFKIDSIVAPEKPPAIFGSIVETRVTPVLRYVIQNYLTYGEGPVHLFVGEENAEMLNGRFFANAMDRGDLYVSRLAVAALDLSTYNGLLLSPEFWDALIGQEKAVCFQTDSCFCPQSEYSLSDFKDYDYIGSDWRERRRNGLTVAGGCGGFSLRDIPSSCEAVTRFDTGQWIGGEDDFFAFHLELLGKRVAKQKARAQFCTQSRYEYPSLAAHRVKTMGAAERMRFFEYCPEAMMLLNTF